MNLKLFGIVALSAAALATPALAHHSFSMFDHEKLVSVSGTVKELEWTNPHVWLHIVGVDAKTGKPVDWSFEMASVGQVSGQGWKATTVKPGDKIIIQMHPLKDGSRGGQYVSAILANGFRFQEYRGDPEIAKSNTIQ